MNETKFEEDLREFFPKIYQLHMLGKLDDKVWEVIYQMLDFSKNNCYGKINISYQKGKINYFEQTKRMI